MEFQRKRKNREVINNLVRAKWLVAGIASILVLLVGIFNYFFLSLPFSLVLINVLLGLVIAIAMTEFGFRRLAQLQRKLNQALTGLRVAEEELLLQSTALEAAANAVLITDNNGRITWVNGAFTKLTGYLPVEAIGQTPQLFRSGEHDSGFYSNLWETIQAGQVWQGELINRRKDETLYPEEQTITPVLDENDKITHYIAIKQDITQRIEVQETERERREWAEALREVGMVLNTSLDFNIVLDRLLDQIAQVIPCDSASLMLIEGGKARVSRSRKYGLDDPEQAPFFVDHVFDLNETANLRFVIESQQPFIIPDVAAYPEWVNLKIGDIIRSWVGVPIIVQDIVVAVLSLDKHESGFYHKEHIWLLEAFAAQAALAWRNAQLFEETRRRARELDLLNRIIMTTAATNSKAELLRIGCTETGRFFSVSQSIAVVLNESKTSIEIVAEYLAPEMPSLLGATVALPNNPIIQKFFGMHEPLVIADTNAFPLPPDMAAVLTNRGIRSVLMVPLLIQEEVVGAVGIHSHEQREFSTAEIQLVQTVGEALGKGLELAYLNEQLRSHASDLEVRVAERTHELAEANDRLLELDRLKSKFVSDVSHELRTPITNLSMYLDLLERGKQDKRGRYLAVLQKELNRLRRLVEDVLSLSRANMSHERGMKFAPVDLNQVVEQVVTAHLPQADAAGLGLEFMPAPNLPAFSGIHNQLAQVATNLLTNAINYSVDGSINVSTYLTKQGLCLQVQDSGIGISPEDLPYLFERFYRGQSVGQYGIPGTGLGLAIIKEIVDIHDGRVEVESEVGQGSTFRVWLPIDEE